VTKLAYRSYQRVLESYNGSGNELYRRLVENSIRLAALWLMRRQHIRFPERSTGGWWWTWRWRFEVLMGWNELDSVQRCRELIRPGMTVIDVGAHIGYYTRRFSEWVGSTGRVFAFEAHPENCAILRANLPAALYHNVEILPRALSDQTGKLRLYVSPGSSNHSLLPGYTEAHETIEVETTTLDSFLAERGIQGVDFIKIDVEGAEPLVLAGSTQTLACSPGLAMLVEYNPRALRCGGLAPEKFVQHLQQAEFRVQVILPNAALGQISELLADEVVNLVCQKSAIEDK